jgi:SAM-dependent methyltransferase
VDREAKELRLVLTEKGQRLAVELDRRSIGHHRALLASLPTRERTKVLQALALLANRERKHPMIHRAFLLLAVLAAVGVGACKRESPPSRREAPVPPQAATPAQPAEHDPAHPPIDCPLHKLGVDPAHVRPFDDAEKYIAFLDKPGRAIWQKPDTVVAALGLKGTETVVDLGAGSGYFTFPIARALNAGKIVALDIEPEMIRHIHHKAMTEGIKNIEVGLAKADDPSVPVGADLVFVCNVLHHVAGRKAWLAKLSSEMKPGARLVLIEFKEGKLPEGPPESVKIPRAEIVKLVTAAGLVLDGEKPDLLPYQTFLVFRKP